MWVQLQGLVHDLDGLDFFINVEVRACHKGGNLRLSRPQLFKQIYGVFVARQTTKVPEDASRQMVVHDCSDLNFRIAAQLPALEE